MMNQLARGTIALALVSLVSGLPWSASAAPPPGGVLPSGGEIVAGKGAISEAGSSMTIDQSTQRMAIDWQNFDIGKNASVTFNQPGASAIALNRVIGQDASQILGSLNANGQVFIVNPAGVLFGKGAEVNAQAILTSTRDIDVNDFVNGKLTFSGDGDGKVDNAGNIKTTDGGYVVFFGAKVSNTGSIGANKGDIHLTAADRVTVAVDGGSLTKFDVTKGTLDGLAENGGLIKADGGRIYLTAKALDGLSSAVVSHSGVSEARTVGTNAQGQIVLGADPTVGQVNVAGTLDASAPDGGDGGQIEASAGNVKVADGTQITTLAANGKTGTFLIDPTDFTIADGSGALTTSGIGANTLSTSLANSNVTLATDNTNGTDNGDIFVNSAVAWDAATTLTLSAYRNIDINSTITASNAAGKLSLEYGQGAVAAGNTATYNFNSQVNLQAGNTFSTKLGSDGTPVDWTVITELGSENSTTTTDLQGMAGDGYGNYALGADIDASATKTWSGLGFAPVTLYGQFDGLGHNITDLYINRGGDSPVGLFGYAYNNSLIQNVGVSGDVTGKTSVGMLAGVSYGAIRNSHVTGTLHAGVVGSCGTLCSNNSSVAGGLVGSLAGTIINSYSEVDVHGHDIIGGLVGQMGGSTASISNSYSIGPVHGDNTVGGLVGKIQSGQVSLSYSLGAIDTNGSNGYAGGLVGENQGSISESYSTGELINNLNAQGLVGLNGGTISASYWDSDTSGKSTGVYNYGGTASVTAVTASNRYSQSAYANFDFTNDWYMVDGSTRPFLRSEQSNRVSSAHQLQLVNLNPNANYILANDIDLAVADGSDAANMWSAAGFLPIGTSTAQFTGSFDGQNHTLDNLTMDTGGKAGLFGYVQGAALKNVTVSNVNVTGLSYVGALVAQIDRYTTVDNAHSSGVVTADLGDAGGLVGYSNGTISNSDSSVNVNQTNASSGGYVGGLVGYSDAFGTIQNSASSGKVIAAYQNTGGLVGYSKGLVTGSHSSSHVVGTTNVGGLVGQNLSTVSNSSATGTVHGTSQVGGLVGISASGSISASHSSSSVDGGSTVGGLVGRNDASVTTSYADGTVTGKNQVGGLIGSSSGSVSDTYATAGVRGYGSSFGGLVGANSGTIANSYASGDVSLTAGTAIGGLVGTNSSGATVTDSYWDIASTTQANSIGTNATVGATVTNLTGIDAANRYNQATYAALDFTTNWIVFEGETRPFLQNEYSTTITSDHQLQLMAMDLSASYTLGNDIDLAGTSAADSTSMWNTAGFVSLGDETNPFTGNLVGQGYTISNLNINRPTSDNVGLFGNVQGGAVDAINLADASITGQNDVGGLAGATNGATITEAAVSGNIDGASTVGGLVGQASNSSSVDNSYSSADVAASGTNAGGLIGQNDTASVVSNSYSTGQVTTDSGTAGGLVGSNSSTITGSYSTGQVTSNNGTAGGLVGANTATISDSYNSATVSGTSESGGIAGHNAGAISRSYNTGSVAATADAGGLAGVNDNGATISIAWSSGSVTGTTAGGLVGHNVTGGTVDQSYWDTDSSGQASAIGSDDGTTTATQVTSANRYNQATYSAFDFTNDWYLAEGNTRPFLRSEYSLDVGNAHQLQLMKIGLAANYTQVADIDASETDGTNAAGMWSTSGFSPVGDYIYSTTTYTYSTPFSGEFNGDGHSIANLSINSTATKDVGLFGAARDATFTDIHLDNVAISAPATQYVGAVVGYVEFSVISGSSSSGSISAGLNTGGLTGMIIGSTISNSHNNADITCGNSNCGGLAGYAVAGALSTSNKVSAITNSYNEGNITAPPSGGVLGGLVGRTDDATISRSYNDGAISASSGSNQVAAGGLVGVFGWGCTCSAPASLAVTDSYNVGSVSVDSTNANSYVGGLIGSSFGTVVNSYSAGSVSTAGVTYVGGLIGTNAYGYAFQNSYWDADSSGQGSAIGIGNSTGTTAITSTTRYTQSTYSGFDFSNTWYMIDSKTRPMLRSEYATSITNTHQLQLIGMDLSADYTLANDIDLASADGTNAGNLWSSAGFTPIGSTSAAFTGRLDGDGHTLQNLTISLLSTGVDVGLFSTIGGSGAVTNLSVTGLNVKGYEDTGGIAGTNNGLISDVTVSGDMQTIWFDLGLVAGKNAGLIVNANTAGTILSGNSNTTGGLVGVNNASIFRSYNTANVTGPSSVGGIAGESSAGSAILQSYNSGTVSGNNGVAGLVANLGGYIGQSYNAGSVVGTTAGSFGPTTVAGLVGSLTTGGVINQSYSSGSVTFTGTGAQGGLVAINNGTVTDSYWDTQTSGETASAGGTGVTASALQQLSTFTGWSISSSGGTGAIFRIYDGNTAPLLSAFLTRADLGETHVQYDGSAHSAATAAGLDGSKLFGSMATGTNAGTYLSGYYSNQQGYDLVGGDLTITPVVLAITGSSAANKTYDGNNLADVTTGTVSGLVSGETLNVSATGTFDTKDAGTGKSVTASYVLTNGTGLASNYILPDETLVADINPATLTISGSTAANKTYDGNNTATITPGTLAGLIGGETVGVSGSGTFDTANVGTGKSVATSYTLSDGTGLAGNYTLGSEVLTADITPATLTITGSTAANKTYDGNATATITTGTLSGLIGGETLGVSGFGTFDSANAGIGKSVTASYTLSDATGLASNYALADETLTADISPLDVNVSGIAANDKVYDGGNGASLDVSGVSFDSRLTGDNLTVTNATGTFSDKNVGSGKTVTIAGVTLGGSDAGNYNLVGYNTSATASITPLDVNVSGITANDKTYDGGNVATLDISGVSFDSRLTGDNLTVTNATGTFSDKNVGSGKTVTIAGATLGGTDAGNYNLVSYNTSATASITPLDVNVSGIAANNRIYDGSSSATFDVSSATFDSFVFGDDLSVASVAGSFSDKNVGTGKTVTISGASLGGTDAGNYNLVGFNTSATADITPLDVNVSGIAANDKTYDGSDAATLDVSGATFDSRVSGDSLAVSNATGAFADKNVGTAKSVTISGATLSGADAGNYNVVSFNTSATASITPLDVNVSGIAAIDKTYDGNAIAALDLSSVAFDSLVSGDNLTVTNATGSFADKNVGVGKVVTISGASLGGADAGNYNLVSYNTSTTANISALDVNAFGIAANSKTYDGATIATLDLSGVIFDSLVSGDNLTVTNATGAFSDKNAGSGKTVTVSGASLGGSDAGNYNLVSFNTATTADITPLDVNVSGIVAGNKTYDGTANATVDTSNASYDSLIAGDNLNIASATGTFSDKNVGSGKTVTLSAVTLGGTDAGNYNLAGYNATTSADITPLDVNVSGIAANDKTYDGTTSATLDITGTSFDSLVPGDSLAVANATGTFSDKNAGSAKTVTISGATLSGTDAGNYNLVSYNTSATASITPLDVNVSGIIAKDKTYDGTANATVDASNASYDSLVAGDSLNIASAMGTFSDKNVGSDKTVTASDVTLGGTDAGNYHLVGYNALTASITPLDVAVSGIGAQDKTYDGTTAATPDLTGVSFDTLVSGDTLAISTARAVFGDKNVGIGKTVTISGVTLGGGDAGNYHLASYNTTATASIGAKDVTVSGITADNKVYDGNTDATLDTSTAGYAGKVAGDTLSVASATGRFDTPDAGTGKKVTISGIALGGADASNYALTDATETTTADITPRPLAITGSVAADKVYDGTTDDTVTPGTLSGMVGSETLGVAATGTFDTKNVGTDKPVTATYTLSDGSGKAGNYSLSGNTLYADVTPKALTISGTNVKQKTFDGTTTADVVPGSLNGLVGNETLTVTATGEFETDTLGTDKPVTINYLLANGSHGGLAINYSLSGEVLLADIVSNTMDLAYAGGINTSNPQQSAANDGASGENDNGSGLQPPVRGAQRVPDIADLAARVRILNGGLKLPDTGQGGVPGDENDRRNTGGQSGE